MTAINATSARKNLYQLIQDVNTNSTPITITNSRGKNAVLLSEDDWNAIQETVYLNSIPGMVDSILSPTANHLKKERSMTRTRNGNVSCDILQASGQRQEALEICWT